MSQPARHPLDIALLMHSLNPRDGALHTMELADALYERGHRVTLFAPAAPGEFPFRVTRYAVELVPVPAHIHHVVDRFASRRAAIANHIGGLPKARRFDVLHAQDSICGNALADLRDRGVIAGFVCTVRHLDHFTDARLIGWQARGFLEASQVLCVSQVWCDHLQLGYGVAARRVPTGFDHKRWTPHRDGSDLLVALRYGLRPGAPVVLALGGIEARKNTLRMLEAFIALRATHPGAQFIVAGGTRLFDDHDDGQRLRALLQASDLRVGVGRDVALIGTVSDPDMPALMRNADVLAMASLREGFGVAALEALASGTPVVVSRRAPFIEYLSPDEEVDHVCWSDPDSVASIAQALDRAVRTGSAPGPGGSTPAVCDQFSWQASAAAHEAIYRAHRALARPRVTNARTEQLCGRTA
jgi:glycosyltransferase-like protein